ncbi:helix-turn-helix domain-containing protein [Aquimarina litoralis]|uniref:helix-turn-helix domain-containing protein n=1 Tax=Aquimarina litoralis TaxID=584605 RepID=UPI001C598C22|nr:AraC family transcriptional regulator [Aquimarina litoralis]
MKSRENKKTEFVYYPHFIETINIFCNATVRISDHSFNVCYKENKIDVILTATKTKFRTAIVKNEYDIIGIQFLPLAIHNFIDTRILQAIEIGLFEINNIPDLKRVSLIQNMEERLIALELFFENVYQNAELDTLATAIELIQNSKGNIRMQELEKEVDLSRRTILRQFKKYLYCSFEDFKNIVRFRLAIENFSNKSENTSGIIGDIAYYDQSDFINHFKSLSGESPKKLFKQIANNPKSAKYFWKLK